MSLETILAELPQLTAGERKIIEDMICVLSDDSSHETPGQSGPSPTLPPRDYWTQIFAGWKDEDEENMPEDLSLHHAHYIYGVPKEW